MIGSLDPGINGCGVAAFRATDLHMAAYVKNPLARVGDPMLRMMGMVDAVAEWFRALPIRVLVVEWPQIYMDAKSKGNRKSLLDLAGIDAGVCASLEVPTRRYLPHEWKGSLDGDAMVERIKSRLAADELGVIEPCADSLAHNVFDAIGIGLKHIGRLERVRVYPR